MEHYKKEFLERLNTILPKFLENIKKGEIPIYKREDYPFNVYRQKLGKNKKEILETIEREGILPLSIPFIEYNTKDRNFYLVYHTIDYEKFKKLYPKLRNENIDERYTIEINGKRYIKTIPTINTLIQNNIKHVIENDISINTINYKSRRKSSNTKKGFLQQVRDFSKKGFAILPIFLTYIGNDKIDSAIIPKTVVEFPNLFSVEHEINVKKPTSTERIFEEIVQNNEPLTVLDLSERVEPDTSLHEFFGREFIIGGHLLPNLINKSIKFFDYLKKSKKLNEEYFENELSFEHNYGLHISTSVPQLIDTKVLYSYLHNIGVLYDLLTRHRKRILHEYNLRGNTFSEFESGFRGIFRFLKGSKNFIISNRDELLEILENIPKENLIKEFVNPIFVKNYKDVFKFFIPSFNDNKISTNYNLLDILNRVSSFIFSLHNQVHLIIDSHKEDVLLGLELNNIMDTEPRVFNNFDKYYEFLHKFVNYNALKEYFPYFTNLLEKLKEIDDLFKSGNITTYQLSELIKSIRENKLDQFLRKNKNKKEFFNTLTNKLIELENFINKNKNKLENEIIKIVKNVNLIKDYPYNDTFVEFLKTYDLLNNTNISDESLRENLDNIVNTLRNIVPKLIDNRKDLEKIKSILESIFNNKKLSEMLMNRLEIRFPQAGYTPDYIVNNLIFISKMTKNLFELNTKELLENIEKDEKQYTSPSKWSIDTIERFNLRKDTSKTKELRNFILKDILGFKESELKLFNQYFEKYCKFKNQKLPEKKEPEKYTPPKNKKLSPNITPELREFYYNILNYNVLKSPYPYSVEKLLKDDKDYLESLKYIFTNPQHELALTLWTNDEIFHFLRDNLYLRKTNEDLLNDLEEFNLDKDKRVIKGLIEDNPYILLEPFKEKLKELVEQTQKEPSKSVFLTRANNVLGSILLTKFLKSLPKYRTPEDVFSEITNGQPIYRGFRSRYTANVITNLIDNLSPLEKMELIKASRDTSNLFGDYNRIFTKTLEKILKNRLENGKDTYISFKDKSQEPYSFSTSSNVANAFGDIIFEILPSQNKDKKLLGYGISEFSEIPEEKEIFLYPITMKMNKFKIKGIRQDGKDLIISLELQ